MESGLVPVNTEQNMIDLNINGENKKVLQLKKTAANIDHFWKICLMDFLAVLGIMDSKQLEVFIYIARHTNPSDNRFIGTYRKIAKATGVSLTTVNTILGKLKDHGYIIKEQNGVWMINPNIIMRGNANKHDMLLSYAIELSEDENIIGEEESQVDLLGD
jgi:DNA-binding transcriptional regulator YhcF (GntR family)